MIEVAVADQGDSLESSARQHPVPSAAAFGSLESEFSKAAARSNKPATTRAYDWSMVS
jgi:hypothetical protein